MKWKNLGEKEQHIFPRERGISLKDCSLEHAQFLSAVCGVSHLIYAHLVHLHWRKWLISLCIFLPYDSTSAYVVVQLTRQEN